MLTQLTEELLDLTVTQKGAGGVPYAVNDISLCCCLSCTCTCD